MTPNALYQALVEAMESHLPPRVVSVVLREGMALTGATPDALGQEAAAEILRGPVFRQLQIRRSPDAARSLVAEMEASLRTTLPAALEPPRATAAAGEGATGADPTPSTPEAADPASGDALLALQSALRPLNLYFSWAEVRKLRSLVQLAEDEVSKGRDAHALLTEAEAQLQTVRQKLEDSLVLQSRTLADLEDALAIVSPLGTPGVRRLDSLIATVRAAHQRRTLAEAEVERAEKLARELRKLVESTIVDGSLPDLGRGDGRPRAPQRVPAERPDAPPGTVETSDLIGDVSSLPPETQDRLRALDVEGEARDLASLVDRYAELLRHIPTLAGDLATLRSEHAAGRTIGDRLATLEVAWRSQATSRQASLAHEFDMMRAELEALPAEVDATDLRRALTVATDVLQDALPSVEDVGGVRDLHRATVARAEELGAQTRERAAREFEQERQLSAARQRLETAWRQAERTPRLREARERLRRALDAHHVEADARDRTAMLLEIVGDAEGAWERAVAEASDDHLARWRARAREMAAGLARLPDIPHLRARTRAVQQEVAAAEARGDLGEDHVQALDHLLAQLVAETRSAIADRLDRFAHEAGEPVPDTLLRSLQDAAQQLEEGGFPDLEEVEREVRSTRDARRASVRRRYLRARQDARGLVDAGVEGATGLDVLVARTRAAIDHDEDGEAAMERLEAGLGEVRRRVDERLAGFEPRLDDALRGLRTVARLNTDDVMAVRRVLDHLDGERKAIARVSPGLQARLFEALADAEARLVDLQAAYETTRAIADQLVSGNRIDDLLGSFSALFGDDEAAAGPETPAPPASAPPASAPPASAPPASAPPASAPTEAAKAEPSEPSTALTSWLDGYLGLDGITGAAVLAPSGRLVAGRVPQGTDLPAVSVAVEETIDAWAALGALWGEGPPDLAVLELNGGPTWVAPLEGKGCALIWSRRTTTGHRLSARLRDDRRAVVEMLHIGPDRGSPRDDVA